MNKVAVFAFAAQKRGKKRQIGGIFVSKAVKFVRWEKLSWQEGTFLFFVGKGRDLCYNDAD
ncbi:MAG: hypothetical protein HFJ86_04860 [Oscillospiraceae bacterium]|jgi:hypothetical protein|nr:hypothetical protein [Oscillospiraceae bacterium]